jgi:hypothetical protein
MSVPAERLPRRRRQTPRQQGLIEPLRLTQGVTRGELATILREASINAAELIEQNMNRFQIKTLMSVTQGLSNLSNALWAAIQGQIEQGIRNAADMAADHQLIRELMMGMPEGIVLELTPTLHFNALQSANDLISRHTNGFTLSQRVYRNSQATVLQVGRIIDQSLALQRSPREIAALVRSFISPGVPGGTSYAAMRLARTEINNAHHETTIRLSKDRPWVSGYKWMLSGSHPSPDICDEYARREFEKDEVPSKPHPQCLCFLVVQQESSEDFLDKLTDGDYDDYLNRQGVLQETLEEELNG